MLLGIMEIWMGIFCSYDFKALYFKENLFSSFNIHKCIKLNFKIVVLQIQLLYYAVLNTKE